MKLAIITGGSRGLGKALVQLYWHQDWTVKELSRSGQSENHIDCDFSDAKQTSAVMDQTFAEIERFKALKRDGQLASADETAEKIAAIIADSPQTGGVYDVNDYALNTNQ